MAKEIEPEQHQQLEKMREAQARMIELLKPFNEEERTRIMISTAIMLELPVYGTKRERY